MAPLVARLYARRIVNINVNVVVAGLLALALTLIPVHYSRHFGVEDKRAIILITFVSDVVFDVLIYYFLHWVANHMPHRWRTKRTRTGEVKERLSYFRDATLVQFERALLSPAYYGVSLGIQAGLLYSGVDRVPATIWAYASGILATRTLHSLWMMRSPRARRKSLRSTP